MVMLDRYEKVGWKTSVYDVRVQNHRRGRDSSAAETMDLGQRKLEWRLAWKRTIVLLMDA